LFFEFVEDFVRGMYNHYTIDNLSKFMKAMVARV
jgi:hypothetical protein